MLDQAKLLRLASTSIDNCLELVTLDFELRLGVPSIRDPAEPDWVASAEFTLQLKALRQPRSEEPWLSIRGLILSDRWKGYKEKETLGISGKVDRERIYPAFC